MPQEAVIGAGLDLEHIGSRKIMASRAMTEPGQDILKHLAEETRHAYFFKRAAEKLARRPLDYSHPNTMADACARSYMGRLDAEIARELAAAGAAVVVNYATSREGSTMDRRKL